MNKDNMPLSCKVCTYQKMHGYYTWRSNEFELHYCEHKNLVPKKLIGSQYDINSIPQWCPLRTENEIADKAKENE